MILATVFASCVGNIYAADRGNLTLAKKAGFRLTVHGLRSAVMAGATPFPVGNIDDWFDLGSQALQVKDPDMDQGVFAVDYPCLVKFTRLFQLDTITDGQFNNIDTQTKMQELFVAHPEYSVIVVNSIRWCGGRYDPTGLYIQGCTNPSLRRTILVKDANTKTLIHEIGHTAGLSTSQHQTHRRAIMYSQDADPNPLPLLDRNVVQPWECSAFLRRGRIFP